jgi:hypothetical protein
MRANSLSRLHDLFFSTYLVLLVVAAHESSGLLQWSGKLHVYYASHYRPDLRVLTDDGYRLYVVAFLLIWVSAAAIFVFLRLLSRFSFAKVVLRTVTGVVAVAGYPLACLYSGNARVFYMVVELGVVTICVLLWAHRKWPVSAPLSIFLLLLHFSLWASLSKFPYLCCLYLWPGWVWNWGGNFGVRMRLVYPLLGLCLALFWTIIVRQAEGAQIRHSQELA